MRRGGERGEVLGRGEIVDRHHRFPRRTPGHAFEPGENPIDAVGVARQRLGERIDIADHTLHRLGIVGQDVIETAQHLARELAPILAGIGRRDEERCLAIGGSKRGRVGAAASQRHRRAPGQPLRLDADLGVGAHRRAAIHRDRCRDATRIGRIERKVGDLADLDAVEQDGRADEQPRHRALKADAVGLAHTEAAGMLQPIDEGKARRDHSEHEHSDQRVAGPCFHSSIASCFKRSRAARRAARRACLGNRS